MDIFYYSPPVWVVYSFLIPKESWIVCADKPPVVNYTEARSTMTIAKLISSIDELTLVA